MRALVSAGEPGVALENYLTQLFEYEVTIPPELLAEFRALGDAMGINKKYWSVWCRTVTRASREESRRTGCGAR